VRGFHGTKDPLKPLHAAKEFGQNTHSFQEAPLQLALAQSHIVRYFPNADQSARAFERSHRGGNQAVFFGIIMVARALIDDSVKSGKALGHAEVP
jgi:hypothetical protein